VDYGGGLNMLQSLELTSKQNELNGTKHNGQKMKKQKSQFVLLSAFCCGKPVLQFQFAKIKLEEEIRKVSGSVEGVTHSIVRPTAYFKSLDGQIESAKRGTYVLTYAHYLE
jgi:divinyl chlorophyllide a 8-vinyl-reductase